MIRLNIERLLSPGSEDSPRAVSYEQCQLSHVENHFLDNNSNLTTCKQRTGIADPEHNMNQIPAGSGTRTYVDARRTQLCNSFRISYDNVYERNLNNGYRGGSTANEVRTQVIDRQRTGSQPGPNMNPEQLRGRLFRGIEVGSQIDAVDGDEPGSFMDAELECLTQPHVLMAQPRYQRFGDVDVRQKTFTSWRHPYPSVPLLVMSGFFFLGGKDSVQCFHCGIILHSWEPADVPDQEHRKHSPGCVFMRQKTSSDQNTVLGESGIQRMPPGGVSHPHTQTDPRRAQEEHEASIKKSIAEMGHTMEDIERAVKKLKMGGEQNLTTSSLVDAVFDVENLTDDMYATRADGDEASGGIGETGAVGEPSGADLMHADNRAIQHKPAQLSQSDQAGIIEKAKKLEKENEELKKQQTCRVCWENLATELFLPCGHLACCENCSGRLRECPYCRKKILRTVHVYHP